ncbi:hypothetical protein [Spirillospora sp. NPDC029432]|uniref:hypothetical protein n=1 Tax=Spirillospora sp. NPDC029432 TaxID=3154599 RepID=UPI00345113D0
MKTRSRPVAGPARKGPAWLRGAGYGGAMLLVAAAVAVLLYPLMGQDRKGGTAAGDQAAAGTATTAPGVPGGGATGVPGVPGATEPQTRPEQGGGTGRDQGGNQGGGPTLPGQGGGTTTWCPAGTAVYRPAATGDALEVAVRASASGLVRAEVSMTGRSPVSQQDTAKAGRTHTFRFAGVRAETVERVKVTTVSVGVSMQTCYARVAG